jgi:hypothetical protein
MHIVLGIAGKWGGLEERWRKRQVISRKVKEKEAPSLCLPLASNQEARQGGAVSGWVGKDGPAKVPINVPWMWGENLGQLHCVKQPPRQGSKTCAQDPGTQGWKSICFGVKPDCHKLDMSPSGVAWLLRVFFLFCKGTCHSSLASYYMEAWHNASYTVSTKYMTDL